MDNISKIPLRNQAGDIVNYATVSSSDFDRINQYSWHERQGRQTSYACARVDGKNISMHRFIMGKPERGKVIDHMNRNGLTNTPGNLRMLTLSQNAQNTNTREHSSIYRGVSWSAVSSKWCVRVGRQYLGLYEDEEEAAKISDKAAYCLYGASAATNGLLEQDEVENIINDPRLPASKTITSSLPYGVTRGAKEVRYLAQVTFDGQKHIVGRFNDLEEAAEAVRQKKAELVEAKRILHYNREILRDDEGNAVVPINSTEGVRDYALVDDEHWHDMMLVSWSLSDGYAVGWVNGSMTTMHKILISPNNSDLPMIIDHKNKKRLDNRSRENLRWATPSENSQNRTKCDNKSSKYLGVSNSKSGNRWRAAIAKDGITYNLGLWSTQEQAALMYNIKARELYEFPGLNDINEDEIDMTNTLIARHKYAKRNGTASKYKWVQKNGKKWTAEIRKDKTRYRLGRFDTDVEAAHAANKKAKELFDDPSLNTFDEKDVAALSLKAKLKYYGVTPQ